MTTDKPSLADKLKSLGVRKGSTLPAPPRPDSHSINSVVAGSFLPHPARGCVRRGTKVSIRLHLRLVPASFPFPSFPVSPNGQVTCKSQVSRSQNSPSSIQRHPASPAAQGRMPSSSAWRVLLTMHFVLQQFFMRDPAEEPALLEGLANFLAPCEALVTFNGKAFDAPLLSTRYRLHQIPIPYKDYSHLDLLPLARRLWRDRLEIARLEISRRACAGPHALQ